jgi:hypothetical protein
MVFFVQLMLFFKVETDNAQTRLNGIGPFKMVKGRGIKHERRIKEINTNLNKLYREAALPRFNINSYLSFKNKRYQSRIKEIQLNPTKL